MRPTKLRAASQISVADAAKQLIGKAMALSPAIRSLRIMEDKQVQAASARYYLRAHVRTRS
jgi:hypothetical protein